MKFIELKRVYEQYSNYTLGYLELYMYIYTHTIHPSDIRAMYRLTRICIPFKWIIIHINEVIPYNSSYTI